MKRLPCPVNWLAAAAVLAVLTATDADAQRARRDPVPTAGRVTAEFRASPIYRLSKIRMNELPQPDIAFTNAIEWLNRKVSALVPGNAPLVRVEVKPVDLVIPEHSPALAKAVAAQAAAIRATDEAWRAAIASNCARRVTVEGKGLSALDILKSCCSQADLQYTDDGRGIVVGNVYFLRWPPVIECRVFPLSEKLVKELGEGVKDVIAPPSFHDFRRDWLVVVPEQNAAVAFHHREMLEAMAGGVAFANENADELIARKKTENLPPPRKEAD